MTKENNQNEKQIYFSTNWYKNEEYQLKNNQIIPQSTSIESYDPFDYYRNPLPEWMVEHVFGNEKKGRKMFIHTSFASLDVNNNQQILNWINLFGFPFFSFLLEEKEKRKKVYKNKEGVFFPNSIMTFSKKIGRFILDTNERKNNLSLDVCRFEKEGLYLEEIKEEIRRINVILELSEVKKGMDLFSLSKNANDVLSAWRIYVPQFRELGEERGEESELVFELTVQKYYQETFNLALEAVSPTISFEKQETIWGWRFDSLLAAIYIMLSSDISNKLLPRRCAYVKCKTYFKPGREKNIYCTPECQEKAKTHRSREKKKMEVYELWKAGKTVEEINNIVKGEKSRIKGWVNKFNKWGN
ncbi:MULTISPECIES: hypothetical protein [Priestia]|uniref:hypothetical protein n=1 Tax=Priestia TaxID=2800373 RepID=UPI00112B4C9F|nr:MULTISPECIES: hypothetical protein [Priestia]